MFMPDSAALRTYVREKWQLAESCLAVRIRFVGIASDFLRLLSSKSVYGAVDSPLWVGHESIHPTSQWLTSLTDAWAQLSGATAAPAAVRSSGAATQPGSVPHTSPSVAAWPCGRSGAISSAGAIAMKTGLSLSTVVRSLAAVN